VENEGKTINSEGCPKGKARGTSRVFHIRMLLSLKSRGQEFIILSSRVSISRTRIYRLVLETLKRMKYLSRTTSDGVSRTRQSLLYLGTLSPTVTYIPAGRQSLSTPQSLSVGAALIVKLSASPLRVSPVYWVGSTFNTLGLGLGDCTYGDQEERHGQEDKLHCDL